MRMMMESKSISLAEAFVQILDAAGKYARAESSMAARNTKTGAMSVKYDKQRRSKLDAMLRRDASAANDERTGKAGATPETTKKLRAQNTLVRMVQKGQLTQDQHNAAMHIEAAYSALVRGVEMRLMSFEGRIDKSRHGALHESEWAIEMAERYTQWRRRARRSNYFRACMDLIVYGSSLNGVKKTWHVDPRTIKPKLADILDLYNDIARRRSKPIHTIRTDNQGAMA